MLKNSHRKSMENPLGNFIFLNLRFISQFFALNQI